MFGEPDHHAYMFVGDIDDLLARVFRDVATEYGEYPEMHPDIRVVRGDRIGIDESREIRILQSQAPVSASKRLFVIAAHALTPEAQNALLKTLEEPVDTARFVIIVPDDRHLLKTLLSRVHRVCGVSSPDSYKSLAETFVRDPAHKRLAVITDLLAGYDEVETKQAARVRLRQFARSLERVLYDMTHVKKISTRERQTLHNSLVEVARVREYIDDPAAALKFLGEFLALALPTVGAVE